MQSEAARKLGPPESPKAIKSSKVRTATRTSHVIEADREADRDLRQAEAERGTCTYVRYLQACFFVGQQLTLFDSKFLEVIYVPITLCGRNPRDFEL